MVNIKQIWELPAKYINKIIEERKRIIRLTDELIAESEHVSTKYRNDAECWVRNLIVNESKAEQRRSDLRDVIIIKRKLLINEVKTIRLSNVPTPWKLDQVDQIQLKSDALDMEWNQLQRESRLSKTRMEDAFAGMEA